MQLHYRKNSTRKGQTSERFSRLFGVGAAFDAVFFAQRRLLHLHWFARAWAAGDALGRVQFISQLGQIKLFKWKIRRVLASVFMTRPRLTTWLRPSRIPVVSRCFFRCFPFHRLVAGCYCRPFRVSHGCLRAVFARFFRKNFGPLFRVLLGLPTAFLWAFSVYFVLHFLGLPLFFLSSLPLLFLCSSSSISFRRLHRIGRLLFLPIS